MLIRDLLKEQQTFTENEKRIAHYLLEDFAAASDLSIEDLAKKTFTSHSAVVRLCKKLGFSGFKELRSAVTKELREQVRTAADVNPNFPFNAADSATDIVQKLAELTDQTIVRTKAQILQAPLEEVAELLDHAARILLFAKGDSQITARSFQNKLVKLNKFLILADEYADVSWNAAQLTKDDCAVFISYGGFIEHYERILTFLAKQGIKTVLITGNPRSTLAKSATYTICATQEEYDFVKIATFSSQISFSYILDTLYSILYVRHFDDNVRKLKQHQDSIQNGLLKEH